MTDMTKSQKRHLRQLAEKCHEIEMSNALEELNENFKKWKNSEITTWDLNEKIHQHHNGKSRDLYKIYEQFNEPEIAVAQAVKRGILQIEEVQENCRPLLKGLIEFYESND
jgi:ATP-dependent helicase/DNAse subunit B